MRDPLRNIEDFIREKLGFLESPETNDWALFEKKLKRALFLKRLKLFGGFTAVALLLLTLNQYGPQLKAPFEQAQAQLHWEEKSNYNPINISKLSTRALRSYAQKDLGQALPKKTTLSSIPTHSVVSPLAARPLKQAIPITKKQAKVIKPEPLALIMSSIDLREEEQTALKVSLDRKLKEQRLKKEEKENEYDPYISPLQEVNPWSYAVNVYPNFTFREFKVLPDRAALLHSDFVDEMTTSEKSGFSLNIGLEVSRRIGAVTYLNSGVEYITNAYQADFDFVNFRDAVIDPNNGEILGYNMKEQPEDIIFNAQNSYHYLNVPLSISFQPWASKHLRLNFEVGGSMLYFMGAEGRTLDYKSLAVIDLNQRSYRKFLGSASMKIGMQYWVNPKVNIGFEPTLMYFTNTIYTEEYPFYVIPYSVGLNFNLQVKLN